MFSCCMDTLVQNKLIKIKKRRESHRWHDTSHPLLPVELTDNAQRMCIWHAERMLSCGVGADCICFLSPACMMVLFKLERLGPDGPK